MVDELVQDRVLIVSYDCIVPDIGYQLLSGSARFATDRTQ